jgi:hypothetical protein
MDALLTRKGKCSHSNDDSHRCFLGTPHKQWWASLREDVNKKNVTVCYKVNFEAPLIEQGSKAITDLIRNAHAHRLL